CGNFTIHARENKLALFKTAYCSKSQMYQYDPPIVVRINGTPYGYTLRMYHKAH
ncbi:hypothetical protein LPJ58_002296, partial [Coemansia sp. RSA 1591]